MVGAMLFKNVLKDTAVIQVLRGYSWSFDPRHVLHMPPCSELLCFFCIYTKACVANTNVKVVLLFLKCLVLNYCSYCMVSNYVSAIKAIFLLYDLPFHVLDHPKVKYLLKALKINRSLDAKSHTVITIPWLVEISKMCEAFTS